MCNAYNLKTNLAALADAVGRDLMLPLVFPAGVTAATSNLPVPQAVFPRRDGLILRPSEPADARLGLQAAVAHWNLTPFFHKGGLKTWKASTNNARSETMATSPAFRDAFKRRRCLVPATSFTEWTGPKGRKTAHAISRADGRLLYFAGLWERCPTDDGVAESYTLPMIAAVAGDDVAPYHNRQPVVLDAKSASIWLDLGAEAAAVLRAPPAGTLIADPASPAEA
jgi:putative SOS response-associated peptidase YedK